MPKLCLAAWEEELVDDCDRDFIISGIKHGFDIIDDDAGITPVSCKNHPSAKPGSPLFNKVTSQVIKEIENGHYVICDTPPKIVSPMAAIPKPDGDVRLIHDCLAQLERLSMITVLPTGSRNFLALMTRQPK